MKTPPLFVNSAKDWAVLERLWLYHQLGRVHNDEKKRQVFEDFCLLVEVHGARATCDTGKMLRTGAVNALQVGSCQGGFIVALR
jgi:hypothetical protein